MVTIDKAHSNRARLSGRPRETEKNGMIWPETLKKFPNDKGGEIFGPFGGQRCYDSVPIL